MNSFWTWITSNNYKPVNKMYKIFYYLQKETSDDKMKNLLKLKNTALVLNNIINNERKITMFQSFTASVQYSKAVGRNSGDLLSYSILSEPKSNQLIKWTDYLDQTCSIKIEKT